MNLKNKLSKREEQRQDHGYREGFDDFQMGGRYGGKGEEVRGLRSTNRQLQNSHRDAKYSIGSGVAQDPVCMTHGHQQWCGDCLRLWGLLGRGEQRRKYWGNCNSIIYKI